MLAAAMVMIAFMILLSKGKSISFKFALQGSVSPFFLSGTLGSELQVFNPCENYSTSNLYGQALFKKFCLLKANRQRLALSRRLLLLK